MSNLLAKERGIGIGRMLARRVNGNQPKVVVQIEKDQFLTSLQDLERKPAGIVSGSAPNDAEALRIDGRGQIMLQRSFARRRQRQD